MEPSKTPLRTSTTSVQLYLNSKPIEDESSLMDIPLRPSMSIAPNKKTWILPPMDRHATQHRVSLRSMEIYNLTPSVPTGIQIITPTGTISIPAGNWTAHDIAEQINYQFNKCGPGIACFDTKTLLFYFENSIEVLDGSSGLSHLGLPDKAGTYTKSLFPPNLGGPTQIQVWTNLSVVNLPISRLLATIPVTVGYGELVTYLDTSSMLPILLADYQIDHLTIELTNQNGEPIVCFDELPWSLCLELRAENIGSFLPIYSNNFPPAEDSNLAPIYEL
jgi:hypothetical protein